MKLQKIRDVYRRCLQRLVRLLRSIRVDRVGIDFPYVGDIVIWTWPWRRKGLPKYISVGFSGTGEFGDARFHTLAEIRKAWDDNLNDDKPSETVSSVTAKRITELEREIAQLLAYVQALENVCDSEQLACAQASVPNAVMSHSCAWRRSCPSEARKKHEL